MILGGGPLSSGPLGGGSGPVSSSAPATVGFVDLWRMWGWWSGEAVEVSPVTLVGRWANVIEYTSPNAPRKYTANRRLEYNSPNERL